MAKLKARGRQEIFRIEKIKEMPFTGFTERYRVQKALMSDGNILEKIDDGAWKVLGKVKPGLSAEQALQLYADKEWKLLSSHPSYFTRSGDVVSGMSDKPLRTEKKAEQEKRGKPGLYITNRATVGTGLAAEIGPLSDLDVTKKAAQKRAREFYGLRLNYLLPVRIIKASSRWDAERNIGSVLWNSAHATDVDIEPGFYITPYKYLDDTDGPHDTFEKAEDAAWEYLRSAEHKRLRKECELEGVKCPPVRIIESKNNSLALQGKGHVWWIDGVRQGPPIDPRQAGFQGAAIW